MIAKQNLEKLNEFETLIISSPNCNDTAVICSMDKLRFCIFRNTNPTLASSRLNNIYGYSAIHRTIEFEGKLFVIANERNNKSTLLCIEENGKDLKLTPVKHKELEQCQEENLLNK